MFKQNMRHLTILFFSITTSTLFFSCSDSMMGIDYADQGVSHNEKKGKIASLTSVGISKWMSGLQDNISISKISIPGTHDSGSMVEGPLSGTAKTQNLTIAEQLNAGVQECDFWISDAGILIIHLPSIMGLFIRS